MLLSANPAPITPAYQNNPVFLSLTACSQTPPSSQITLHQGQTQRDAVRRRLRECLRNQHQQLIKGEIRINWYLQHCLPQDQSCSQDYATLAANIKQVISSCLDVGMLGRGAGRWLRGAGSGDRVVYVLDVLMRELLGFASQLEKGVRAGLVDGLIQSISLSIANKDIVQRTAINCLNRLFSTQNDQLQYPESSRHRLQSVLLNLIDSTGNCHTIRDTLCLVVGVMRKNSTYFTRQFVQRLLLANQYKTIHYRHLEQMVQILDGVAQYRVEVFNYYLRMLNEAGDFIQRRKYRLKLEKMTQGLSNEQVNQILVGPVLVLGRKSAAIRSIAMGLLRKATLYNTEEMLDVLEKIVATECR